MPVTDVDELSHLGDCYGHIADLGTAICMPLLYFPSPLVLRKPITDQDATGTVRVEVT